MHVRYFDAIAELAKGHVKECCSNSFVDTVWAFARAGHSSPVLFDAIAETATSRLKEFDSQGLANTAWAFATVGHASLCIFDAIPAADFAKVREHRIDVCRSGSSITSTR